AEADPEGEGDARGLRAAGPPARHQQAQVGARGPRLRDAAPAQVRGDQGDGQRAPRRPRGARARGGDGAQGRAREGGHPGRDLGPREFFKAFRTDLFADEVYVFTPQGEVKVLPAGSTPIDFAYAVHTDVGHRMVGAKINGRIVPLHYRLKSGDFVEILTAKVGRGP